MSANKAIRRLEHRIQMLKWRNHLLKLELGAINLSAWSRFKHFLLGRP